MRISREGESCTSYYCVPLLRSSTTPLPHFSFLLPPINPLPPLEQQLQQHSSSNVLVVAWLMFSAVPPLTPSSLSPKHGHLLVLLTPGCLIVHILDVTHK